MTDPVFVYDDDCGFCTWWAEFFRAHSDLQIIGFSELDPHLRDRLPDAFETCSHLVTDEAIYSCGASIEEAFLRTDVGSLARLVVGIFRRFRGYRAIREWSYRRGANNRDRWGKLLSRTPPARMPDEDRSDGE